MSKLTPVTYRFRTECRNRNNYEKLHTTLGHAKNAINGAGGGRIFEWIDNEWKLLYDVRSLPAPWQIEAIEKKRKADQARIDKNREKAEQAAIKLATQVWDESHSKTHKSSFVEGFVASTMVQWDYMDNWSKIMWN